MSAESKFFLDLIYSYMVQYENMNQYSGAFFSISKFSKSLNSYVVKLYSKLIFQGVCQPISKKNWWSFNQSGETQIRFLINVFGAFHHRVDYNYEHSEKCQLQFLTKRVVKYYYSLQLFRYGFILISIEFHQSSMVSLFSFI